MGGGDLNSKKSWHPNTMKNQERVWKAEQAAAEEKKRIQELQHERAAERDRAELNELAKRSTGETSNDDNRLHWMYDKPDKKAHHEDYLLGKTIEKNYDQPQKTDDIIPAVARRVVGSSMMTSSEDTQVDLARKMREDPLLLVKERERAARAALLNNPIHRKRLAELLRKEQEQKKGKEKKPLKKGKNLDNMLAAKLNALGGDRGLDIAALLASDDSCSSTDSSDEEKPKKKKKKAEKIKAKKAKKKSKKKSKDDTDSSGGEKKKKRLKKDKHLKDNSKDRKRSKDRIPEEDKRSKGKLDIIRKQDLSKDALSYKIDRKERSESCDSDIGSRNKKNNRFSHQTRRIDRSPQVTRRSRSMESGIVNKNKRYTRESSGEGTQRDNLRKGSKHNYSQNSTSKKDNKPNWDHARKERKRSSSHDIDTEPKYKRSRRDSFEQHKQRKTIKKQSGSDESDGDNTSTKNRKYSSLSSRQIRSSWRETRTPSPATKTVNQNRGLNSTRKCSSLIMTEDDKEREGEKWKGKKTGLTAEERAARLAEMAAAGVEREVQRGLRVAEQLARQRAEEGAPRPPRSARNEAHALPDSLESRIHSNRHYIQRGKQHMNEHFARR